MVPCFCVLPGKARMYLNNVVLPFGWREIVQGGCERYYDEKERKREIFSVNRGYKELVERLDIEIIVNNVYLPGDVISTCLLYTSRCV